MSTHGIVDSSDDLIDIIFGADQRRTQADGVVVAMQASVGTPDDNALLHTCLLYTSPSPRDKRQSRMPSSA